MTLFFLWGCNPLQPLQLSVNICIYISQVLAEPLRGQPYQAPVSKCFLTSAIVSGFGIYRWEGSLGRAVSGRPLLQSLFHFCPCLSFRQEQFWINIFEMCEWPHPSTWGSAYLLKMFSTGSISSLLGISANIIPIGTREPLASLASGAF